MPFKLRQQKTDPIGIAGSFHSPSSQEAPYPKPGLPMLRIVIPKGLLTQSLSKANFVCFLLFSFSPAYTSELVTLP
jgi:hypothetical protein